eukprot:1346356-Alexandrium_andersonii.AAC.1
MCDFDADALHELLAHLRLHVLRLYPSYVVRHAVPRRPPSLEHHGGRGGASAQEAEGGGRGRHSG